MVNINKKKKCILMLVFLLGLSGCGRKDVDYSAVTEGQDKTTSGVEEQADIGEDIPGHVECTIDLKTGDLTHQDIGQMQMYVNYYTKEKMNEGANPPIGIILCSDKSETLVKYILPKGKIKYLLRKICYIFQMKMN